MVSMPYSLLSILPLASSPYPREIVAEIAGETWSLWMFSPLRAEVSVDLDVRYRWSGDPEMPWRIGPSDLIPGPDLSRWADIPSIRITLSNLIRAARPEIVPPMQSGLVTRLGAEARSKAEQQARHAAWIRTAMQDQIEGARFRATHATG